MLQISINENRLWDEKKEQFVEIKPTVLKLEHSLISLSKWESKWKKSFISSEKTTDEMLDYIRCMSITPVEPEIFYALTKDDIEKIVAYIDDPMTATTISHKNGSSRREIVTAEIIYYWMIALNIPIEFQKWHLNKLITLIEVCNEKNQPPKKMSKSEILNQHRAVNAMRRKQHSVPHV